MNADHESGRQAVQLQGSPGDSAFPGSTGPQASRVSSRGRAVDETLSAPQAASAQSETLFSVLGEIAETILLAIVIFLLIRTALQTFRIDGSSMEPHFYDGQFVVVDKITPRLIPVRRGDVVVFDFPGNPKKDYIKRVIGLPGEIVEIREGRPYVNEEPVEEPYEVYPAGYYWGPGIVGERQVFVLGDNRAHSSDSHNWGMLDQRRIVGRTWLTYWPPESWGLVPRYSDVAAEPR